MIPIKVVINNVNYSLPELTGTTDFSNYSPFETEVIKLIRSWLNNQQEFHLKTSGSTGDPKNLVFSRDQIKRSIESSEQALGLRKGMNALISLSPKYVAGMMMILRSLEIGMNMILVEPSSNPLKSLMGGEGIDFAAFVPLQMESILVNSHTADLAKNIEVIIVGGAPLSIRIEDRFREFKGSVYSTYGMTETLTHIALKHHTGPELSDLFQVIKGVSIDTDHRSCLVIHSPVTKEAIITNDIVELSNDKTQFRWLGRADFVINSGGIKIHPESIENEIADIFRKMNLVNRYLVIGIPDDTLGERSVLLIEGQKPAIHEEIEYALKHSLEKYLIPKEIHYLPSFSYTDSGKLDRVGTKKFFLNG